MILSSHQALTQVLTQVLIHVHIQVLTKVLFRGFIQVLVRVLIMRSYSVSSQILSISVSLISRLFWYWIKSSYSRTMFGFLKTNFILHKISVEKIKTVYPKDTPRTSLSYRQNFDLKRYYSIFKDYIGYIQIVCDIRPSCDYLLELKCSIFTWPAHRFTGSISPSLSVSGTLIYAGSDSFTSFIKY